MTISQKNTSYFSQLTYAIRRRDKRILSQVCTIASFNRASAAFTHMVWYLNGHDSSRCMKAISKVMKLVTNNYILCTTINEFPCLCGIMPTKGIMLPVYDISL